MNKQPPTYDNDNDLRQLVYTELTDEKLLDFIFKKGGKVNVINLSYLVHEYGQKQIAQHLVNLETAGLIAYSGGPMAKVTMKARWERFRDSKNVAWIIAIVSLLIGYLSWLASRK